MLASNIERFEKKVKKEILMNWFICNYFNFYKEKSF